DCETQSDDEQRGQPSNHGWSMRQPSAESSSWSNAAGSRRTRLPSAAVRLCRSTARGSVSGRSRPSRISPSSIPPSPPQYDEHPLQIDPESVEDARVGLEVGEVVLLFQPGIHE